MTRIKKAISVILVLAIVFGMVSMMAYAANLTDLAGKLTVSVNIDTGRNNKKVIPGVSTVDAQVSLKTEFYDGKDLECSGSGQIVFTYEKEFFEPIVDENNKEGIKVSTNNKNAQIEENSITLLAYNDSETGRIIVQILADQDPFNYDDSDWLFSIPMKVLETAKKGETDADGEGTIAFDKASINDGMTDFPLVKADDPDDINNMVDWKQNVTVVSTSDTVSTNNTVTFVYNNGTTDKKVVDGTVGEKYSAPVVSYTGYKLEEWINKNEDGDKPVYNPVTEEYEFVMPTDENVEYQAAWDPKTVTVTYNVVVDGSTTIQVNSVDYEYGEAIYLGPEYGDTSTEEVKVWYTDKNLTTPMTEKNNIAKDNVDLYGKLEDKGMRSVTFYYNDENQEETSTVKTYNIGDTIEAPTVTQKYDDGTEFIEWMNLPEFMPPENITVYARYSEKEVLLSYYKEATDIDPYWSTTLNSGDEIEIPDAPDKTGYTFAEWQDVNGNPLSTYTAMPSNDLKLYAVWDPIIIDVSYFVVSDEGTKCVNVVPYEYGAEIYLGSKYGETTTKEVKQWYEDKTCTDNPVTGPYLAVKENISLYGKLEDKTNKYNVTFKYMNKAGEWITTEPTPYDCGDVITAPIDVPTPLNDGSVFKGWDNQLFMGAEDMVITAVYDKNESYFARYYLDENSLEPYAQIDVAYDETIDTPDDPEKEGYEFTGWTYSDGKLFDEADKMPKKDIALYANFDLVNITVKYIIIDNETGESAKQENSYPYGTEINLNPPESLPYGKEIKGWYGSYDSNTKKFSNPITSLIAGAQDVVVYCDMQIKTHTATFKYRGVNAEEKKFEIDYKVGELITEPTSTEVTHYIGFVDWDKDFDVMPDEDVTFTAQYTHNAYYYLSKADYEADKTYSVQDCKVGDPIEMPGEPDDPEGYIFNGWKNINEKGPSTSALMPEYSVFFIADFKSTTPSGDVVKLVPANNTSTAMIERSIIKNKTKTKVVETYNSKETKKCIGVDSIIDVNELTYGDYTTNNNYADWFVYGLKRSITVTDLLGMIKATGNGIIKVYNSNDEEVTGDTSVGTAWKIKVFTSDGITLVEEFQIVIFGDANKDGAISGYDSTLISMAPDLVSWRSENTLPAIYRACDLNQDGKLSGFDGTLSSMAADKPTKINQITGRYTQ